MKKANFYPVCDYLGVNPPRQANGTVFLAVAAELGTLPHSEMAETALFGSLPENLTYPNVTPRLFTQAARVLDSLKQQPGALSIP